MMLIIPTLVMLLAINFCLRAYHEYRRCVQLRNDLEELTREVKALILRDGPRDFTVLKGGKE